MGKHSRWDCERPLNISSALTVITLTIFASMGKHTSTVKGMSRPTKVGRCHRKDMNDVATQCFARGISHTTLAMMELKVFGRIRMDIDISMSASKKVNGYRSTYKYGHKPTVQFPKDAISFSETVTRSTARLRIWSALVMLNLCGAIRYITFLKRCKN